MSYDVDFYKLYEEYLKETSVRKAHDWVFGIIENNKSFRNVVDLGCGKYMEFLRHTKFLNIYIGIDVNAIIPNIQADYRKYDFLSFSKNYEVNAFVSLFSSEITAPYKENYRLYERLFHELRVEAGLVSGFYYANRKTNHVVEEAGGIVSYQTLESIEEVYSDTFSEKRIVLPVPSKLFGDDVVEVWKIFEKRE